MPRFYESGSVQRYWTINSFKKYCAILVEVCEHESRMIPLLMDGKIAAQHCIMQENEIYENH